MIPCQQNLFNHKQQRLLHSLSLVAVGLSVVYETWPTGVTNVWLDIDRGSLHCSAFYVSCNALKAHMSVWNPYHFPKATHNPLHSPNGRHKCLPLGLCKETVKQSMGSTYSRTTTRLLASITGPPPTCFPHAKFIETMSSIKDDTFMTITQWTQAGIISEFSKKKSIQYL